MRSTSAATNASGFTLIEMLIIAPVVILAISGFVALMVNMVGDVLTSRDNATLAYNSQDALDRIEQDTRLSLQFLTTTGSLTSPQGSNNNFTGTSAFTNNANTLILSTLATDSNPTNNGRRLLYYANQPNVCGTLQTYNTVFSTQTIYFIKDSSLWRRTIVPDYNFNASPNSQTLCVTPATTVWQQNSCSPGYTATRCQTNDAEVMKNIASMDVKYFNSPGSTSEIGSGNAGAATTIEVTLTGQKVTAGRTFTNSVKLRATKLNTVTNQ